MVDFSDPETLWLNLTNLGLGIVTLAALVGVGVVLVREIIARVKVDVPSTDHALLHPDLGLTMADGGEPIQTVHTPGSDSSKKDSTSFSTTG